MQRLSKNINDLCSRAENISDILSRKMKIFFEPFEYLYALSIKKHISVGLCEVGSGLDIHIHIRESAARMWSWQHIGYSYSNIEIRWLEYESAAGMWILQQISLSYSVFNIYYACVHWLVRNKIKILITRPIWVGLER